MIISVKSSQSLRGKIFLPPSKSYSIRAFIIAACGGKSKIIDPSNCDDALVSMRIAKQLGAKIKKEASGVWTVDANHLQLRGSEIHVKESGTVLRFLLPLVALRNKSLMITGEGTLIGRPNLFLTDTLRKMGAVIKGKGRKESVPVQYDGVGISSGKAVIDGSLSSQFISALLIALPQLRGDSRVCLEGQKIVSYDYIKMTLQVLALAGIEIKQKNVRNYVVPGSQKFKGLKKFTVPSDYGLAAFLLVAALLTDSNVELAGHLKDDLIQADGAIIPLLKKMGAKFTLTSKRIKIKGPILLKGGSFSLKSCPDLVPIMSICAMFAKGKTRLYDIKHARAKESDRISDLAQELRKCGVVIEEKDDEFTVIPQENYKMNCVLDPHKDHRLAMSFCVLGLKLGVSVKDMECSSKSYPDFLRDLKAVGGKIKIL